MVSHVRAEAPVKGHFRGWCCTRRSPHDRALTWEMGFFIRLALNHDEQRFALEFTPCQCMGLVFDAEEIPCGINWRFDLTTVVRRLTPNSMKSFDVC